jgi:hypothetical protein
MAAAGVVIVLPLLKSHWEDLLVGRLKEPDIDPSIMFPRTVDTPEDDEPQEVGLHVYHIEKFGTGSSSSTGGGPGKRRFSEFALDEITRRAQLQWGWKGVGMSGGCMCSNICLKRPKQLEEERLIVVPCFGCAALAATQSGRRTFERLGFTPTGYRELFVAATSPVSTQGGENGQVDMVCVYAGDEVDKAAAGRGIISVSEMVVRHSTASSV